MTLVPTVLHPGAVTARAGDDAELTRLALAAGQGDDSALAELVRATQADVWRFCASLNSRDAADDLTQETFARAIPSLRRFEARASARTWLLAIARRVAADSVRRSVRRRQLLERAQLHGDLHLRRGDAGTGGAVDLMQLVDALPRDRREAFVLTQILGLEYAEAADVIGCPIGTIRSRVARARRDLVEATTHDERAVGDER